MALYKYKEFSEAIDLVNRITSFSGPGHSCGIHRTNDMRGKELSHKVRVSRIMVRDRHQVGSQLVFVHAVERPPRRVVVPAPSSAQSSFTMGPTYLDTSSI